MTKFKIFHYKGNFYFILWDVIFWVIWVLKHILNTFFFITFFETSGTNLHGNVVDTDEKVDGVHV